MKTNNNLTNNSGGTAYNVRFTGGDKMTARFLYNEYFDFYPIAKFWLAINHKPVIRGTDKAIWRRIRLIPIEVCANFVP